MVIDTYYSQGKHHNRSRHNIIDTPHDVAVHIADYTDTESTLAASYVYGDKHPMLDNSAVQETKRLLIHWKSSHGLMA